MQHDQGKSSRLFAIAGGLLTVSGLLMAVCGRLAYGGDLLGGSKLYVLCGLQFPPGGKQKYGKGENGK